MATKKLNQKEELEKLLKKLLSLVDVKADFETHEEKGEEGVSYRVVLDSPEEAGILIGAHGTTLFALQSFVNLALRQKFGEWVRVTLDIGDWRSKQEEHLVELAMQAVKRAKETGEPQNLYNLSADQRRIIHMALSKEKGIITESQGEGEERYLVVKA